MKSIITTYITGNVSRRLGCYNSNGVFFHVMSFEQVLAVRISVIVLKTKSVMLKILTMSAYVSCVHRRKCNESETNLADVDSVVSGLQKLRGIRREMISVHELLSTGFVVFLHNYSEGMDLDLL